jgi:hypothetical protein
LQNAHDIRTELNASAHLTELRRTLQQLDRQTALRTRQRGSQAANAAACDQHRFALVVCHEPIVHVLHS